MRDRPTGRMQRVRRAALTGVLSVVLLGLSGCVYFNTYYLARRNFQRAETLRMQAERDDAPLPREAQTAYTTSLQYASKVLSDHPESKWAEEALLLSQKVLFRQGDHPSSIRKAQELRDAFPGSPFLPESRLFLARSLLAMEQPGDAAREAALAREGLEGPLASAARLIEARSLSQQGHLEEAEAAFLALIAEPDTPQDIVVEARIRHSEMLERAGRYMDAAATLDAILQDERHRRTVRFQTLLRRIDMLLRAEDLEAARADLEALDRMDETGFYKGVRRYYRALLTGQEGDTRKAQSELVYALLDGVTAEWEPRVRLDLARTLERNGNFSDAIPEYRAVTQGRGTPQQKQEAARRLDALLDLYALRTLASHEEKAVTFPDPRVAPAPAQRGGVPQRRALADRREIEEVGGAEDVRRTPQQAADVPPGLYLYLLAEQWQLGLSKPDSALAYLDLLIREHPGSSLVPKALYAVTRWAPTEGPGASRRAEAARRLTGEFAETEWAYWYRRDLGEDPPLPEGMRAHQALREAEDRVDLLAGPAQWSGVLPDYFRVAEEYPATPAARLALLGAARLIEMGAGSADSARAVYERVTKDHPGTEEALQAQARLEGRVLPRTVGGTVPSRLAELQTEVDGWTSWFQRQQPAKVTLLQPNARQVRVAAQGETLPGVPGARPGSAGEEVGTRTVRRPPPPSDAPLP